MQFFDNCTTLEEVKAHYKQLALTHHPDRGGDTATMQLVNAAYAFVTAKLLKGAKISEGDIENEIRFSEEYRKIVEQIIHLPGIKIELVGLWIWVTGNTRPVKNMLKTAGLFYASKKSAWYYRSEILKAFKGGKKSLDEIRNKYGSEEIISKNKNTQHRLFHS